MSRLVERPSGKRLRLSITFAVIAKPRSGQRPDQASLLEHHFRQLGQEFEVIQAVAL
jgi:hypothetical protein